MKPLRTTGTIISQLSYDVFLVALAGYMVALALESMKAGSVVRYFNLNDLLLTVVVSGVLAVVLPHPDVRSRNTTWYYMGLVILSLLVGFIVFQLTAQLDIWARIIAVSSTLLVCSAGIMIQTDS